MTNKTWKVLATAGLWYIRLAIVWITSFILYMWWCFHEGVDPNHPFTLAPDLDAGRRRPVGVLGAWPFHSFGGSGAAAAANVPTPTWGEGPGLIRFRRNLSARLFFFLTYF